MRRRGHGPARPCSASARSRCSKTCGRGGRARAAVGMLAGRRCCPRRAPHGDAVDAAKQGAALYLKDRVQLLSHRRLLLGVPLPALGVEGDYGADGGGAELADAGDQQPPLPPARSVTGRARTVVIGEGRDSRSKRVVRQPQQASGNARCSPACSRVRGACGACVPGEELELGGEVEEEEAAPQRLQRRPPRLHQLQLRRVNRAARDEIRQAAQKKGRLQVTAVYRVW